MPFDPVTAALDIGSKIIDKIWPDPAQAAQAKLALLQLQQSGDLAQIAVNTAEATNPSIFVSGWRPCVGWVCGLACAWNWIGLPIAKLALELYGHPVALAPADLSEMMPVLLGMLGLGGLRTVEKINGVARS
jgi:Holin of 3TMs, for gene-transfer release